MNITSKSRYALKIMMDLAQHGEDVVHRSDIAARQGIPLDYMDQILSRLREAGLISSMRGRGGGYRLARSSDEISMHEIFTAVEDSFEPVQCLDGGRGCLAEHFCGSKGAWGIISGAIRQSLSGIILSEIAGRPAPTPDKSSNLQECRAPRRRALGGSKYTQ